MMEKYSNLRKGSKIVGYECGFDYINVWFEHKDEPLTYSYNDVGVDHVNTMKKLAAEGHGLHRYIKRNVDEMVVNINY